MLLDGSFYQLFFDEVNSLLKQKIEPCQVNFSFDVNEVIADEESRACLQELLATEINPIKLFALVDVCITVTHLFVLFWCGVFVSCCDNTVMQRQLLAVGATVYRYLSVAVSKFKCSVQERIPAASVSIDAASTDEPNQPIRLYDLLSKWLQILEGEYLKMDDNYSPCSRERR